MTYLKSFVWIVLASVVCFSVRAADFTLGAEGGVCLSHFTGNDANAWDTKTDFCGYGLLNLPIDNAWSVFAEAGYCAKGTYVTATDYTITLNYLELPLLLRYRFPSTPSYPLSAYIGPNFGFLMSAEQDYNGTTSDISDVKSTDIGITVGGMMEIPMNFGSLFFDVRYTQGFNKPLANTNYRSYDLKNCALAIMAGLNFNLGTSSRNGVPGEPENRIQ